MVGKGIDNSPSQVSGNDGRYIIVTTRWNTDIVDGLLRGARQALPVIRFMWCKCPGPSRFRWPVRRPLRARIATQ